MKNQDPDSRYQRYDFNVDGQKRRTHKKALIWPWILGLIIIVLALAFGIRYVINKHTSSHTKPTSAKVASKQKSTTTTKSNTKKSDTTDLNESNSNQKDSNSTDSHPNSTSNNNQNDTTTDITDSKSTAKTTTQSTDSAFSQPRTFNSVEDAKNWAKTTQSQWLAAGYNNYTITQNGQGFYVLTFIK